GTPGATFVLAFQLHREGGGVVSRRALHEVVRGVPYLEDDGVGQDCLAEHGQDVGQGRDAGGGRGRGATHGGRRRRARGPGGQGPGHGVHGVAGQVLGAAEGRRVGGGGGEAGRGVQGDRAAGGVVTPRGRDKVVRGVAQLEGDRGGLHRLA